MKQTRKCVLKKLKELKQDPTYKANLKRAMENLPFFKISEDGKVSFYPENNSNKGNKK